MRIALVSQGTPFSKRSWSGIPYFGLRELKRRFPDTHMLDIPRLDALLRRASVLSRIGFFPTRHRAVVRYFSWRMNRRLAALSPDVVISIGAPHKVVDIDSRWLVIHITDGCSHPSSTCIHDIKA